MTDQIPGMRQKYELFDAIILVTFSFYLHVTLFLPLNKFTF